jgi:hypothetical protein
MRHQATGFRLQENVKSWSVAKPDAYDAPDIPIACETSASVVIPAKGGITAREKLKPTSYKSVEPTKSAPL